MSRVQGLTEDQVSESDILQVFQRQQHNYGTVLENHAVLARRPGIFRGFRVMWDELDRGDLVGARLTGLVNVRVAGHIGCTLCLNANATLSRAQGVSDAELKALSRPDLDGGFAPAELAALAYADAMTMSNCVPDETFAELRRHFSDDAIVELTAAIAWEICSAKFNRALEIDWDGTCPLVPGPR
jgi:AhpD family alkylhydroperoxidase